MSGRRAPLPLLALLAAAIALAFGTDQPLVLAALAAGALGMAAVAGRRVLPMVLVGTLSAVGLVVLTPLLGGNGNLIVLDLPRVPVTDGEVTLEELAAGAAAGARVLAVTTLIAAVLVLADQDRTLALAMRLAPRSALACALAARSLPTLKRDAVALTETARSRGVALGEGSWLGRGRRAAPLVVPLVGSSLERGLDVAEAMAARGYGAGPRTRLPEARVTATDVAILTATAVLLAAFIVGTVSGGLRFDFYPTLEPVWGISALALAGATLVAFVVAIGASRR